MLCRRYVYRAAPELGGMLLKNRAAAEDWLAKYFLSAKGGGPIAAVVAVSQVPFPAFPWPGSTRCQATAPTAPTTPGSFTSWHVI